jgi:hypothetical protein
MRSKTAGDDDGDAWDWLEKSTLLETFSRLPGLGIALPTLTVAVFLGRGLDFTLLGLHSRLCEHFTREFGKRDSRKSHCWLLNLPISSTIISILWRREEKMTI